MALTITGKLAATVGGVTVQNATSVYSHGEMAGTEVHQTVYRSVGTSYVTLTAASSPTIGVGSVAVGTDHFIVLRNVGDDAGTGGTWLVSFDAGTTDHLDIPLGGIVVLPMNGGKYISVKASAADVRLEIVAAEI